MNWRLLSARFLRHPRSYCTSVKALMTGVSVKPTIIELDKVGARLDAARASAFRPGLTRSPCSRGRRDAGCPPGAHEAAHGAQRVRGRPALGRQRRCAAWHAPLGSRAPRSLANSAQPRGRTRNSLPGAAPARQACADAEGCWRAVRRAVRRRAVASARLTQALAATRVMHIACACCAAQPPWVAPCGAATALALVFRDETVSQRPERVAQSLRVLARPMRRGDGGYDAGLNDGGARAAGAEQRRLPGCWASFLACAMSCFDALSCCATAAPSPPRLRRVTTQTSVERLLPQDSTAGSDAQPRGVLLAPPTLMLPLSRPGAPRSPEPHPLPRTCAEGADYEESEDDVSAAKRRAALELPEECPLCLEVRQAWRGWADIARSRVRWRLQDFDDPDNPPQRLACTHRFHLPCLLALEQRSRFCPCCATLMVHPALGRD